MENYFEFENIEDKEKVRIAKTRLKWHVLLWWNCIQVQRWKNSRPKITSWYTMMDKMKSKFLPSDYKVHVYKKMQILRQRYLDLQGYIEEFHKLDIRMGHDVDVEEKMTRYLGD